MVRMRYHYDVQKIEELYNKGFRVSEIARELNLPGNALREWIRRNIDMKVILARKKDVPGRETIN